MNDKQFKILHNTIKAGILLFSILMLCIWLSMLAFNNILDQILTVTEQICKLLV